MSKNVFHKFITKLMQTVLWADSQLTRGPIRTLWVRKRCIFDIYAGLHSWSFRERFREDPDFTIFQAVDLTAQMGFSSLEILTGTAGRPPEHVGTDDPQDLRRLVRYARGQGVRIYCFSTYNDFAFLGPWRNDNIAYIFHWIELAAAAEVPNLRLLTGYYQVCAENTAPQLERQKELTPVGLPAILPAAE